MGSFSEELALGFIWCVPIHVFVGIAASWFGYEIKYDLLLSLLADPSGSQSLNRVALSMDLHHAAIMSYFIVANFGAAALGIGLHWLVLRFGLDKRFSLFRFPNEWSYLFDDADPPIDLVYISAVVNEGGRAVIYWGILADYFFNKEGGLDRIYLQVAEWSEMQINATEQTQAGRSSGPGHPIEGDYFVLRYADILNLNVEHIRFRVQPSKD